jgi:hypothetical protein
MMLVSLMLRDNLCFMYFSHNQWNVMYTIRTPYMLVSAVNQLNKTPQVLLFFTNLYIKYSHKVTTGMHVACYLWKQVQHT